MNNVKLIWDFRGPNASQIAKHHAKHLKEFIALESLKDSFCDTEQLTEMHHIAFMVINKEKMEFIRERLKPNRGQLYKP